MSQNPLRFLTPKPTLSRHPSHPELRFQARPSIRPQSNSRRRRTLRLRQRKDCLLEPFPPPFQTPLFHLKSGPNSVRSPRWNRRSHWRLFQRQNHPPQESFPRRKFRQTNHSIARHFHKSERRRKRAPQSPRSGRIRVEGRGPPKPLEMDRHPSRTPIPKP